jgi:hypothetical protein
MAKPIVLSFEGVESSFDHAKLDRARLYGARRRVPLDQEGLACVKAALTTDGLYLLQSGMTAQGYFDEEGRWLQRSQLVGLGPDGNTLELQPSTLGVAQVAEVVDPSTLLRYTTDSVYTLEPASVDSALASRLDAGDVLRFGFNYGADYHQETAFLVKNSEGFFCLVGTPILPTWCESGQVALVEASEEAAGDDLDFEMF